MDYEFKIYRSKISEDNDPLRYFFDWIKEDSTVLDIGCSSGCLGEKLNNEKNCNMYGFEFNPQSIELALKTGAYSKIHNYDLNQKDESILNQYHNFFDYIALSDVVEHLINPDFTIETLKPLLKEGGRFLISVPNIAHCSIKANLLNNNFEYKEAGLMDSTHIHFFTYKTLAKFLANHNLEIVNFKTTNWVDKFDGDYDVNPYKNLPKSTEKYIMQDKHSLVTQYVVECKLNNYKNIYENNLYTLDTQTPLPKKSIEVFLKFLNIRLRKMNFNLPPPPGRND